MFHTCFMVDSPIGTLRLEACVDGLVALSWTNLPLPTSLVRGPEISRARRSLRKGMAWLRAYFAGRVGSPPASPAAHHRGRVWEPFQGSHSKRFAVEDLAWWQTGWCVVLLSAPLTWAGVHGVTGKPILADTGYGAAGASAGEDPNWNVAANINARIADGVISISQYNPGGSWGNTISSIRGQLSTPSVCP